ncbi:homeobox protein pv.1 [Anolis carolinensis]|uniref:homeobox protein pv.1 n=1 Tax=Anolis carolinensis TaxID=28377 RepID=UPI002F2B71CA
MTKAPFASVAWLSQSSRTPKEPREEPPEARRGKPCAQGKPSGGEGPPSGPATPPEQQPPPSPRPRAARPPGPSSAGKAQPLASFPRSLVLSPHGFLFLGLFLVVPGGCGADVPLVSPAALASPEGEWGSDGEGSPSEGPPAAKSSSSHSPRRRLRTAFSLEQISTLESAFQRHRYLGAAQRRKLAAKMRLSEVQIKTWFQNRRMKLKRQMQEAYPSIPFNSPLPFGSQSGPLSYMYSPHQQTVSKREDPMPLGLPFPPLPAPLIDPRSLSAGQPGAVWPMPLPCLVGYQDPQTVFMSL